MLIRGSFAQTAQQQPGVQCGLHELAVADALAQHTRPKLETFGDALFLVVYSPVRDDNGLVFIETQLFVGKGTIISARYGDSAPYSRVRSHCEVRTCNT